MSSSCNNLGAIDEDKKQVIKLEEKEKTTLAMLTNDEDKKQVKQEVKEEKQVKLEVKKETEEDKKLVKLEVKKESEDDKKQVKQEVKNEFEEDGKQIKIEVKQEVKQETYEDTKLVKQEVKEEATLGLALEKLSLGPKKKKLLVLSLSGLLIHRAHRCNTSEIPRNRAANGFFSNKYVYKRPFLDEFLKFCLERFEVGIWSSAQEHNVEGVLDCAFKGLRRRLLFVWDQYRCSDSGFMSLEKNTKPLFFKDLTKLWASLATSRGGQFNNFNTLLIDDHPYKALLNPPNTGIFPATYDPNNAYDNALDPKGELVAYLEGLAEAESVPSYVKEHHFGQPAIVHGHPDWNFYCNVLRRVKKD